MRKTCLRSFPEESILQYNLTVPQGYFRKNLLREKSGHSIGRLDSRYLGMDHFLGGSQPDYPPEMMTWFHAFTPPVNFYFREHLKFKTDIPYNMLVRLPSWDVENHNTRDDLRMAMLQNPFLKVMYQVGYYDGGTPYFNSKYSMWQLDQDGRLADRIEFKAYRSGHMMYLRREDLKTASNDLRSFIFGSMTEGKPARYLPE